MFGFIGKIFGTSNDRNLKRMQKFVDAINRQTVLMRPISVELSTGEFEPASVYEYKNFYIVRQRGGSELESKVALGNVI